MIVKWGVDFACERRVTSLNVPFPPLFFLYSFQFSNFFHLFPAYIQCQTVSWQQLKGVQCTPNLLTPRTYKYNMLLHPRRKLMLFKFKFGLFLDKSYFGNDELLCDIRDISKALILKTKSMKLF